MQVESSLRYRGWRVATVSAVGLSFAAYVPYTFPLFLKSLSDEFSWSREDISTAYGINAVMSALCAAPLGYLVDRVGARKVVPAFLALFGCTFASLSVLSSDLRHLYAVFALLGIFVTGILPIAFARTCLQLVRTAAWPGTSAGNFRRLDRRLDAAPDRPHLT